MSDLFYRAFEERLYASRETIRGLRQQYLPFVAPLQNMYPGAATFDLGCGRGEWLELMQEAGFTAFGVDLDEGMLQACQSLQLPAQLGDAVAHLAQLPDNSHAVISAFHVVEHISFTQLRDVVASALRVLKPGGLLIMETPNPENPVVGTNNFYIDPTHQRPIPWHLLSFMTEHQGFARTKVLRLQELPGLLQQQSLGLHDVFGGASPDYAVIAQKDALSTSMALFDEPFSREYGTSLAQLCQFYDRSLQGPVKRLDAALQDQGAAQQALDARTKASDRRLSFDVDRLGTAQRATDKALLALDGQLQHYIHHNLHQVALDVQSLHRAHHALSAQVAHQVQVPEISLQARLAQAEARAQHAEHSVAVLQAAMASVYASSSWRLLALPRWVAIQLKLLLTHGPLNRARSAWRKLTGAPTATSPAEAPAPYTPPEASAVPVPPPIASTLAEGAPFAAVAPGTVVTASDGVPREAAASVATELSERQQAIHHQLGKALSGRQEPPR